MNLGHIAHDCTIVPIIDKVIQLTSSDIGVEMCLESSLQGLVGGYSEDGIVRFNCVSESWRWLNCLS